jgi:DNA-binding CsgD family transcriptional regulator
MTKNKAIVQIQQLCCLGLDKTVVLSEFLLAIRSVLPSDNNTFTLLDGYGNPYAFLLGHNHQHMDEQTCSTLFNFFTPDCKSRLMVWFSRKPVFSEPTAMFPNFYLSDMYNLVYRRFDQHHTMLAPVMHVGKPVGILNVFRPRQQQPFNNQDQQLMAGLLPYIAHALSVADINECQYIQSPVSGMIVMDTSGHLLYLDEEAKRLLVLAGYPMVREDIGKENPVLSKLAQLCRHLNGIFQGKPEKPPTWNHVNGYGRFTFSAFWLNQYQGQDSLVGINIQYQEPLLIRLWRALQKSPLTLAQRQVALLVGQSYSNEQVGLKLHIKLATVKEHIHKIFSKLAISRREDIVPTLLALGNPDQTAQESTLAALF